MKQELTDRQSEVLNFIKQHLKRCGYPPTMREIQGHFGLASIHGVNRHLEALEKKGHIRRESNTSRGMILCGEDDAELNIIRQDEMARRIPIIGRVAAGLPITAVENHEGSVPVDSSYVKDFDKSFALKVKGDSMIDDGIFDGDLVVVSPVMNVEHNQIIVARIGEDVTVKRLWKKEGNLRLMPANKAYNPIDINNLEDFSIIGRVVGVIRWL